MKVGDSVRLLVDTVTLDKRFIDRFKTFMIKSSVVGTVKEIKENRVKLRVPFEITSNEQICIELFVNKHDIMVEK